MEYPVVTTTLAKATCSGRRQFLTAVIVAIIVHAIATVVTRGPGETSGVETAAVVVAF